MIDRLEGAGFVERRQDPDDRRRVIVVPLEDRLADIAPLYEGIASGWRALLERATEPQLEFLVEFLDGVHHLTREQIDQLLEKG
jgi:DNA-binding MarR family transcriptional regulator